MGGTPSIPSDGPISRVSGSRFDQHGEIPPRRAAAQNRRRQLLFGLHPRKSQPPGLERRNVAGLQADLRILGHRLNHGGRPPHNRLRPFRVPRKHIRLPHLEGQLDGVGAEASGPGADRVRGGARPGGGPAGPLHLLLEPERLLPRLVRIVTQVVSFKRELRIEIGAGLSGRSHPPGGFGPCDLQREAVSGERLERLGE